MAGFQKVEKVLKFGQNKQQLTVEQARAAMLAAGQAPGSEVIKAANQARRDAFRNAQLAGLSVADQKALAQQASDAILNTNGQAPVIPTPQVAAPVPATRTAPVQTQQPTVTRTAQEQRQAPVAPPPQSTNRNERGERIETKNFVGEISQKNGEWVAEITYKVGAGTERFVASTKNGLMVKLLEGKGNATMKVRDTVRQQKLGDQYEHTYQVPVSQEVYDKMPVEAKKELVNAIAAQASVSFKEDYPEFYPTAENSQKILDLLNEKKAVITYKNLVRAYEELVASEELDARPGFEVEVPTVIVDSLEDEDSSPVPTPAAAVSTAPAAAPAPEPQLRKRGSTGLVPGFSTSGGSTELELTEEGNISSEPSVAELKKPVNRQY